MLGRLYKRLLVRRALYGFHRRLFLMGLHGMGVLNTEDFHTTGEAWLHRRLARVWPERPVVLDVGANVGLYASAVKRIRPHARVFAFEPNPAAYARLQEAAAAHDFEALNRGCGSEAGERLIYDYTDAQGSGHASLHAEVFRDVHRAEATATPVHLVTLDDFVAERGLERIDLLKIDTEGNELDVLRGATRTLEAGRVRLVQFEFNEMNAVSRSFFRDFREVLSGFTFHRMLPDGLVALEPYRAVDCEIFAPQNILAVSGEGDSGL